MRKLIKRFALTVMAAVCLLNPTSCGVFHNDAYINDIRTNWDYAIPRNIGCNEIYVNQVTNLQGDGNRYHVFSYENEASISTMCLWEGFQKEHENKCETLLNWLDVPTENRPDYENCEYFCIDDLDNQGMMVYWDAQNDTMHVLESFM